MLKGQPVSGLSHDQYSCTLIYIYRPISLRSLRAGARRITLQAIER